MQYVFALSFTYCGYSSRLLYHKAHRGREVEECPLKDN